MLSAGRSLVVLGWHNVHPTWCFPAQAGAGEKGMEAQFRALRRVGNVVPLESALRDLVAGRPLPPRAVAITFDDGYTDNLEVAGPMLRRLGLPATCFLVPGILDGEVDPWWERLAWIFAEGRASEVRWNGEMRALTGPARRQTFTWIAEDLKKRDGAARLAAIDDLQAQLDPAGDYDASTQFLDWEGARRLQEYFTIGSHTMSHNILSRETAQAQHADLAESRRRLVEGLGAEVAVLAYPNGKRADYDDDTVAAAEAAGYEFSITTRPGPGRPGSPPHEIPRWVMNPHRGTRDFAKVVKYLVGRAPS